MLLGEEKQVKGLKRKGKRLSLGTGICWGERGEIAAVMVMLGNLGRM
jgi:hypothetical protein